MMEQMQEVGRMDLAQDLTVKDGLAAQGDTVQHISFAVDDELYGVDIMAVREIKAWTEVTTLPRQPDFVRGVLNLRGVVVPIFDLRCRFGNGRTKATPTHVIIIVQIQRRLIGLLVDRVSDILTISEAQVQPVPATTNAADDELFSGLVAVENQMVALLDLEQIGGQLINAENDDQE